MSNFDDLLPYGFALIVAVPFVILLRQFVFQFIKLKNRELSIISGKSNVQIRLQAYERMTLFLERMKPSNLVQKFDKELAAVEFVFLVEKNIMEEFEYNASQQLYISQDSWNNILNSKNNVLQLLHKTLENSPNVSLQEFKTLFLMGYVDGEDYISDTIQNLRNEISRII